MDNYFKHESSYVDDGCIIGEGTKIWHFSHIMTGCRMGRNCYLKKFDPILSDFSFFNE